MGTIIRHGLSSIAVPGLILAAAYLAIARLTELPASLTGPGAYGTYGVLGIALGIGVAFRRGRVLLAVLTLALAQAAHDRYLTPAVPEHVVFAVFGALCVFVPFNLAALSLVRERGLFNRHGLARFTVIALEAALAAWLALPGNHATREWLYAPIIGGGLATATAVPQLGVAAMVLSLAITALAAWRSRSAIDVALAGAAAAFAFAAHGVTTLHAFDAFIAAGSLILAIGVLQDTFRMAFRDELTGLPSRRALNEQLAGLGRRYTIAMLDVDHFKNLNDTHGHDVGDQVLKLVASRLARATGGARAYRFGGEEFTLVFPGAGVNDALPHLEALREDIAAYEMEMRRARRAAKGKRPKERDGASKSDPSISVTISIGVAESGGRLDTPEAVVQAADKALYRAKDKGRNRVSR